MKSPEPPQPLAVPRALPPPGGAPPRLPARSAAGTRLAAVLAVLGWALLPAAHAATLGGDLAVTSDYIYRGVSESDGRPAAQLDLHATTAAGTFAGMFASTRDPSLVPGAAADIEAYLGQRFVLGSSWNAALTAYSHNYVGGHEESSDDYQAVSAQVSYLDLWTASVTEIPNEVRYAYGFRVGRYAAAIAETSAQWLFAPGLFLTAGMGYYHTGAGRPYEVPSHGEISTQPAGYAYGNLGLAYQHGPWRLDVGYFLTQRAAQQLLPFPRANRRVAATLSWHF